jgi:hypothetical protein
MMVSRAVGRRAFVSLGLLATSLVAAGTLNVPISGAAPQPGAHGHSLPPAHAASVNPHKLPVLAPEGDTPSQVQTAARHYPVDEATYQRLKANADAQAQQRDRGNQASLTGSPEPQFATLGSTSTGGWNPPDGALAVGPTSVLSGANEAFAIYGRSGSLEFGPVSLQNMFGEPSGASVYDPRALYDAGNAGAIGYNGGHGRFVLAATDGSNLALAISQNETPESPATAWCTYLINGVSTNSNGSTDWVDYPSLGMDADSLYLTSNQFSNVGNSFQYPRVMVVSKASVYPNASTGACGTPGGVDFTVDSSGAPLLQNPGGGASFTVQPANMPDAVPGSSAQGNTMYLVNSIWSSGSNLVVRSITTGPGGTAPVLNAPNWVTSGWVAPYNLPAGAPQPNSSNRIDTGDDRLLGATFRYGSIFTANTTGSVSSQLSTSPSPYANVQWYQITPTSSTTSTASSSAVTNSGVALFFPGVLPVCSTGPTCTTPKVVLEMSASGRSQPASAARVANGTLAIFAKGVSGYRLYSRWGDYPAVAADPADSGSAWLFGEYARTTSSWGTAVTSVTP